ncbi:hypothetical protein NPIL_472861 [Nephila pilipes]|uniref:Uncharacterized protein n=1 Tax=Nephila pilipes TaxID=299642 RepID=A0A8X6QXS7_NEPPI|nr:hypothetical protein NPIL_472861 [Nephila pilipes]
MAAGIIVRLHQHPPDLAPAETCLGIYHDILQPPDPSGCLNGNSNGRLLLHIRNHRDHSASSRRRLLVGAVNHHLEPGPSSGPPAPYGIGGGNACRLAPSWDRQPRLIRHGS